jgi:hypothetical protein
MPPESAAEWFSVEHDDETYLFDITFLSSNWNCIYGAGCPGIDDDPAPELARGCCSHGAHLLDKDDRRNVKRMAERLSDEQWQFKDVAAAVGGPVHRNDDNDWVTRTHDGACIFLNRPDFERGSGCALHVLALDTGERYIDTKPTVCWQVPLRLDYHTDDRERITNILTEWKRRDWGAGGEEFCWWCTEAPEAFNAPEPVWVACRDEIVEMVGLEPYEALAAHLTERRSTSVTLLPHPTVRTRDAAG